MTVAGKIAPAPVRTAAARAGFAALPRFPIADLLPAADFIGIDNQFDTGVARAAVGGGVRDDRMVAAVAHGKQGLGLNWPARGQILVDRQRPADRQLLVRGPARGTDGVSLGVPFDTNDLIGVCAG